jgi:Skp family chaperone for outer membrane proteins
VALAAVGVAVPLASYLRAQTPGSETAPAQTKVGLVNLSAVIQGYAKFKLFQQELKDLAKPYQESDDKLKKQLDGYVAFINNPTNPEAKRQECEGWKLTVTRQREDNLNDFKKKLEAKRNEQVVQLYKEVEEAVQKYAGPNGFHVILQYNDSTKAEDRNSATYLQFKLERSGGACMPIYIAGGLDITNAIVANLNARYGSKTQ